jgi:5-methyltetrahydropteroyltriglutamate--homocysteine methyltransferase
VGSQQRPPELLAARESYKAGRISKADLTAAEDAAIAETLRRQAAIGLDVMTDGEFRRDAWMTDVQDAIDGFVDEYPVRPTTLPDGTVVMVQYHGKPVNGKLRQRSRIASHEATFLAAHAAGPFKLTLPSPNAIGNSFAEGLLEPPYPDRGALLADLVPIYQAELSALAAEGVPYIQLDQTIGRFTEAGQFDRMVANGQDPEALIAEEIDADNACLSVLDGTGVVTAKHLCRGSRTVNRGVGGYDWLAERVFPRLNVDRFLLEYDSENAGGFEPLRHIPKGKVAVLGLITSKDPTVEDPDELMRRIDLASKFLPVDQLAISPQCGFGGSAENNFMSVDEQFRKLENMAEVAERVWG